MAKKGNKPKHSGKNSTKIKLGQKSKNQCEKREEITQKPKKGITFGKIGKTGKEFEEKSFKTTVKKLARKWQK